MEDTYDQAEVFLCCFGKLMDANKRQTVADYAALKHKGPMTRRLAFLKNRFYKYGLRRIIAQFLWA